MSDNARLKSVELELEAIKIIERLMFAVQRETQMVRSREFTALPVVLDKKNRYFYQLQLITKDLSTTQSTKVLAALRKLSGALVENAMILEANMQSVLSALSIIRDFDLESATDKTYSDPLAINNRQ